MQLGVSDEADHGTHFFAANLEDPNNHPQYSIRVAGCTPKQYPVVTDSSVYSQPLHRREIFDDMPHPSEPAAVEAFKRLKPVWELSSGCFHWAETSMDEMLKFDEGTE
ncbi:hypothetical protein FRB95_009662 [Tulasnella sp. JGI-2019a]|nr:hypothetical protein FRB95_009662 [Tulasnella sp. JGI-2019a]